MEFLNFIPVLQYCVEEIVTQKSKLCDSARVTTADIINRAALLHDAIDKVKENLLVKTKRILDSELKKMEFHEEELKTWISWLSSQNDISNQNVPEVKDESICKFQNGNRKEWLARLQQLSEIQHISLYFKSGEVINEAFVNSLFGSVQNFSITPPSPIRKNRRDTFPTIGVERRAKFKSKGTAGNIHAIAPISGNEAWICCGWGNKEMVLYNMDGDALVSVTLDVAIDHIVSTRNGNVLVSSYNGNSIWRLDEQLNATKFATLSFVPRGMAVAESNEIYVCGVERNRRHLIAKFAADGTLISDITISPHDPHRLGLISEDKLCFSDYSKNNKRQLVIMDNTCKVQCTYNGKNERNIELENPFYPLGTQVDQYGNIIVADWNNDRVHLLDTNGQFSQFLVDTDCGIERPCSLGLDRDGKLWVGNATGHVHVFSYCNWLT
ncbi:uncharacterized protein LOC133197376 [Saccostrea echinata]|uniref:uncharacterized protein LOC133197376 n=1 Tax=Saccostrea echinata TaxID=191078 RepID=UPI002A82FEF3|nr:uncharacterized protein LOC133197376 [Saccostrea echinata]